MQRHSTVPTTPGTEGPADSWITTLETFDLGILGFDRSGRVVYRSAAAERLVEAHPAADASRDSIEAAARETILGRPVLSIGAPGLVTELPIWIDGAVLALYTVRPNSIGASYVGVIRPTPRAHELCPVSRLTPREVDVARLITAGLPTKTIAFRLGISAHTARHHIERLFAKLGVRNRAGAAALLAGRIGRSSHGPSVHTGRL